MITHHRSRPQLAALLALVALQEVPPATAPVVPSAPSLAPWGERGPLAVESRLEEWHDAQRDRDVPVKLWFPKLDAVQGALPIVLFSHGLGGTRENYAYFGEHVASHGYVSVHLQHVGSDDAAWRDQPRPLRAMERAASDPANIIGRPLDVSFAIDELTRLAADPQWPLHGRLDLARIAIAGHSFGAFTALAAAGRKFVLPLGRERPLGDARVKACVAMSAPATDREKSNGSYDDVVIPCLHLTGTKDTSPIGDTTAEQRRIPYDTSPNCERWLLILKDADHGAFGDSVLGDRRRDPAHHPLILAASTAFLDATLKGDAKARAWLSDGGYAEALGARGTFEHAAATERAR